VDSRGTYRLTAQPLDEGELLSSGALKVQALTKTLTALHVAETQTGAVRKGLEEASSIEIETEL
jgi:hypothetical protein